MADSPLYEIEAGLVRAIARPPGTVLEYLGDGSEPAAVLLGSFSRVPVLGEQVDFMRLPLETSAQAIARPSLPLPFARSRRTHHEMVARGAAAVARPVSEFEGFRVVVPDPPIGSHVALWWRM